MASTTQEFGPAIFPTTQSVFQPRILLILLLFLLVGSQEPPPNYPHDQMPDTNFTCSDKATGGYYADPEAGCQMFHVCVRVSDEEIRDFRFLCPNNTVFDQQNFICTNWWDIDCKRSTRYYSKNDLFRVDEPNTNTEYEYEDPFTTYEYVYEYEDSQTRNSPDYVYEYYDTDTEHRFGSGGRAGKSQISSTSRTISLVSSTATTPTPTTTTSTTPRSTTTTTTTPKPITRTTTPRITTLRPSNPFRTIRIGKPVVSISSSSRYEVSSSSSPSSSSKNPFSRLELAKSQASSTRTTRQDDLTTGEDDLTTIDDDLTDSEEDAIFSGVKDPFEDFDWRRDPSAVTASTQTRYEQRFRGNSAKARNEQPIFSTASRNQEFTLTTIRNRYTEPITTTTEKSRYNRSRPGSPIITGTGYRASNPDPALEEYSNFRYYKTVFGRNRNRDSSATQQSTFSTTSSTTPSPRSSAHTRGRVRPAGYISARSASRNTRYSVYG